MQLAWSTARGKAVSSGGRDADGAAKAQVDIFGRAPRRRHTSSQPQTEFGGKNACYFIQVTDPNYASLARRGLAGRVVFYPNFLRGLFQYLIKSGEEVRSGVQSKRGISIIFVCSSDKGHILVE